jgi:hypothetical protein
LILVEQGLGQSNKSLSNVVVVVPRLRGNTLVLPLRLCHSFRLFYR